MDWSGPAHSEVLPPLMHDPVTVRRPVLPAAADHRVDGGPQARAHRSRTSAPAGAYLKPDAWASIWMGVVSIATTGAGTFLALLGYAALYAYVAPWHLPVDRLVHVGDRASSVSTCCIYAYHRMAHRVRLFWATHQAHHSSQYFNFATALRQKWNISGDDPAWIPLPLLGVPPWMVFASFSINLVYQFWIHTERIDKLWRPIEFVFNTPSHHRVHHGMDQQYLDKNYGGILILWDRLFGSFAAETVPAALRPDQAGRHLQHLEAADARVRRDRPRRPAGTAVARPLRLRLRAARVGTPRHRATRRRGAGHRRILAGLRQRRRGESMSTPTPAS